MDREPQFVDEAVLEQRLGRGEDVLADAVQPVREVAGLTGRPG
jgi:hypothetical protein